MEGLLHNTLIFVLFSLQQPFKLDKTQQKFQWVFLKLLFFSLSPCFDLSAGKLPPSAWNKVECVCACVYVCVCVGSIRAPSAKNMIYIHNDRPAFGNSPLWLRSATYVSLRLIKEQFCSSLHMLPAAWWQLFALHGTAWIRRRCCRLLCIWKESTVATLASVFLTSPSSCRAVGINESSFIKVEALNFVLINCTNFLFCQF